MRTKRAAEARIKDAEAQVEQILAELERDTGMLVQSILLASIDVTNLEDSRPVVLQKVQIEMFRIPSHEWAVGE